MQQPDVLVLTDVDDTLIDTDRVTADLRSYLDDTLGAEMRERYFAIFEQIRAEEGFADYLGAIQRYRLTSEHDPRLLLMSSWLVDYPFAERILPGALDTLDRLARLGPTVVFSDGDAVFQPRKIIRSGLWKIVDGRVMIFVHKETELAYVQHHYPARHYVVLDDKLRILSAIKREWGERVTTVFVRQGHYANDPQIVAALPPADVTVNSIADVAPLTDAILRGGT